MGRVAAAVGALLAGVGHAARAARALDPVDLKIAVDERFFMNGMEPFVSVTCPKPHGMNTLAVRISGAYDVAGFWSRELTPALSKMFEVDVTRSILLAAEHDRKHGGKHLCPHCDAEYVKWRQAFNLGRHREAAPTLSGVAWHRRWVAWASGKTVQSCPTTDHWVGEGGAIS